MGMGGGGGGGEGVHRKNQIQWRKDSPVPKKGLEKKTK